MFTKKPIPSGGVNFLRRSLESERLTPPKKRNSRWVKWTACLVVFCILAIVMFSHRVIVSSTENIFRSRESGILTQIKNIFTKSKDDIAGAADNRINILILGIGGPEHEGPNLTDTIIIASIEPSTPQGGKAALISVPRDMYGKSENLGSAKINSFYALGQERENLGGEYMKQVIEEMFDLPIHYFIRIDFNGFIEFIDAISGIDVEVERAFTDYQFPAPNYKTQTVSFTEGLQHFDGLTTLQFARSRHGTNGEGSDFARARRQQKIILAVKDQLMEKKTLLRPAKIKRILSALGDTIETDMEPWEIIKFADILKTVSADTIIEKVLDDAPGGPLYQGFGADGAFLLIPKDKETLPRIARDIFETDGIYAENPRVVIQNGTAVPGFAKTIQEKLEELGLSVLRAENAEKQSYTQTVIFDLTHGLKPQTRAILEQTLHGNVSPYVPVDLWQKAQDADFVIILGGNT